MRFIADRTLGKLARKLRALGFDAAYWGGGTLEGAAKAAAAENRILLTRSRKAPQTPAVPQILVIDSDHPREQVEEVLAKLDLAPAPEKYFSRCIMCNEELHPISKEETEGRVPDFIYRSYDSFHICPRCRRIYWPGTHLKKMEEEVENIKGSNKEGGRR